MTNPNVTEPMKTDSGSVIRLCNLHFGGDWIGYDAETGTIFHTVEDGGDVDPITYVAPVTWMHIEDGVLCIGVLTSNLMMKED